MGGATPSFFELSGTLRPCTSRRRKAEVPHYCSEQASSLIRPTEPCDAGIVWTTYLVSRLLDEKDNGCKLLIGGVSTELQND